MVMKAPKLIDGFYLFKDFPEFRPNVSPKKMFESGVFGGTYWTPLKSGVTGKIMRNDYQKYKWFAKISDKYLVTKRENYDKKLNKYGTKVGTSLEYWEEKGWITKYHPRGWVQWYCDFFIGKRCPDDQRQISRWLGVAGPKGRFSRRLINMIVTKKTRYDDRSVSPKIRQTLLHWACEISPYHM